jgi:UDP-glucose 4-epimerase
MRVLVTGAAGRIGANLAKSLLERGHTVRAFVLPGDPKEGKLAGLDLEIHHGDLRDAEAVDRALDGVDGVVHLGYIMGRPKGMSRATEFEINIPGTFNMLEAASKRVDKIERFVFASTNATYDAFHYRYVPIDESHPQSPYSFYGSEKLIGERMLEGYGREFGLRGAVVRFGTVPGPDEMLRHLRARQVMGYLRGFGTRPGSVLYAAGVEEPWRPVEEAIAQGYELVIPRNLEGKSWMQDLVDVRDTVQGIICALEHPNAVNEAFNVTGFGVTWEDAVTYLAEKVGQEPLDLALPNMWYWRCDNTKAKSRIGYMPEYNYPRMIDDALAFEAGEDIGVFPA